MIILPPISGAVALVGAALIGALSEYPRYPCCADMFTEFSRSSRNEDVEVKISWWVILLAHAYALECVDHVLFCVLRLSHLCSRIVVDINRANY